MGVYVGSLKKSPPTRLIAVDSNAIPAGDHLYFVRQGTLWAQRFDQAHLRLTAEPVRIAEHVWAFSGHGGSAFSASDRSVVFRQAAKQITELWWLDRNGRRLGSVGDPGEHVHVTLSPDDRRVAIERLDTNGNGVIWLHEIERGATSRFSFDPSWNWSPIWSPDGSRIAFAAAPDGKAGIFQKPTSGATEQEPLFTGDLLGFPNDWSSNGEWLMWSRSAPGTDSDIWGLRLSADRKPCRFCRRRSSKANRVSHRTVDGLRTRRTSRAAAKSTCARFLRATPSGSCRHPAGVNRPGGATAESCSIEPTPARSWRLE
jgi:dipeptidyl aminopeptidase/acylaminoacyl peptidase